MNNNLSQSEGLNPIVEAGNKPSIPETVTKLGGLTISGIPAENKLTSTMMLPVDIPISNISQSTSTTLDFIAPPVKQIAESQILSSITLNKPNSASNIPDRDYKGRFDTNPNVGFIDSYRNPNYFPNATETVTYSANCSSNYITHLFLLVIAIYIALRRNGGFSFGPVLAAFCCPHIYILYAFYGGFCAMP